MNLVQISRSERVFLSMEVIEGAVTWENLECTCLTTKIYMARILGNFLTMLPNSLNKVQKIRLGGLGEGTTHSYDMGRLSFSFGRHTSNLRE